MHHLLSPPARDGLRAIAGFAAFVVVLSLPTLVAAPSFLGNRIFEFDYLANLVQPLKVAQLAGIWPVGDFRFVPGREAMTYALVVLVALAAAGGVAWAVRRRMWALPVYAAGAVISCLLFFPFVTPWIEGKALAMAAPAVPVAAIAACTLFALGRRVEGAVLAALVTGGVLWSNALQYHDVSLAPRAQLAELEGIGERFAGQGPALMTEFNPYGVRHLLRKVDAEGASDSASGRSPCGTGSCWRRPRRRTSTTSTRRRYASTGRLCCVAHLPTAVLRLITGSTWSGRLVRRLAAHPEAVASPVAEHLPIGDGLRPGAVPDCAEVERLAAVAGDDGRLATVVRPGRRHRGRCPRSPA